MPCWQKEIPISSKCRVRSYPLFLGIIDKDYTKRCKSCKSKWNVSSFYFLPCVSRLILDQWEVCMVLMSFNIKKIFYKKMIRRLNRYVLSWMQLRMQCVKDVLMNQIWLVKSLSRDVQRWSILSLCQMHILKTWKNRLNHFLQNIVLISNLLYKIHIGKFVCFV